MANFITFLRIVCAAGLLFQRIFSPVFYVLYLLAGVSDAVDGPIARAAHSESALGARLDTAADMALFAAVAFRLLPVLSLPVWLWIWVALIAAIKLFSLFSGFFRQKKLPVCHSKANKLTGLLLFLFPLCAGYVSAVYIVPPICLVASFAAVEEAILLLNGKELL